MVLSLAPGGTERLVVEICRRVRHEFDVAVCCLDEPGGWAHEVEAAGIPVFSLWRQPGFRPRVGLQLARLASVLDGRLLHCHQYSPFVYGTVATIANRALKLVYTEHGRLSDAPPSWKRRAANRVLAACGGSLVSVSRDLRDYMTAAALPAGQIDVIHNGIDPGPTPAPGRRQRARSMLGLDARSFILATVARLDPVKDFDTLLEAFARVRRARPEARLIVIGDGPERARVAVRSSREDLRGAVDLVGYRPDVRDLLAAADVYVNSSITEGISITILEAMAAGLPVVATAVGGTPEVVFDGVTGLLVPARDPARLADAIASLADQEHRRVALGRAGRRRVESAFTVDRMVAAYVDLYHHVLD